MPGPPHDSLSIMHARVPETWLKNSQALAEPRSGRPATGEFVAFALAGDERAADCCHDTQPTAFGEDATAR